MRNIILSCLTGILLFVGAGCKSAIEVKQVSLKKPIVVQPNSITRTIQFKQVDINIAKDTQVGQIKYWSGPGSRLKPIIWKGDNLSISEEMVLKLVYRELTKANYPITGDPNAYFIDPHNWRAELLISGSIDELQEFIHCPEPYGIEHNEYKGTAYLKVKWQIYSRLDGKVIYETHTEGSDSLEEAVPDGDVEVFLSAFANATRNLFADQELYNLVVKSKPIKKPISVKKSTPSKVTKKTSVAEETIIVKKPLPVKEKPREKTAVAKNEAKAMKPPVEKKKDVVEKTVIVKEPLPAKEPSIEKPAIAKEPAETIKPAIDKKKAVVKKTTLSKERTVDLGNGVKMELVLILPGEFMMGSETLEKDRDSDEGPVHMVKISKPFYMGKFEVTRAQFACFVNGTKYVTDVKNAGWAYIQDGKSRDKAKGANWENPGFPQQDTHPAVCVSWNDAKAFCEWLSHKEGKKYSLPTEAQWEYACRANTTTQYSFMGGVEALFKYCNYADSSTGFSWRDKKNYDGYRFTAPIRSMQPNAFGLYDMHGNVWEWCSDWYDKDYYSKSPSIDPEGPSIGKFCVLRSGAWYSSPRYCRSANRSSDKPNEGSITCGFRIVQNF